MPHCGQRTAGAPCAIASRHRGQNVSLTASNGTTAASDSEEKNSRVPGAVTISSRSASARMPSATGRPFTEQAPGRHSSIQSEPGAAGGSRSPRAGLTPSAPVTGRAGSAVSATRFSASGSTHHSWLFSTQRCDMVAFQDRSRHRRRYDSQHASNYTDDTRLRCSLPACGCTSCTGPHTRLHSTPPALHTRFVRSESSIRDAATFKRYICTKAVVVYAVDCLRLQEPHVGREAAHVPQAILDGPHAPRFSSLFESPQDFSHRNPPPVIRCSRQFQEDTRKICAVELLLLGADVDRLRLPVDADNPDLRAPDRRAP